MIDSMESERLNWAGGLVTPSEALEEIRNKVTWLGYHGITAHLSADIVRELVTSFESLDELLSNGGERPTDWKYSR